MSTDPQTGPDDTSSVPDESPEPVVPEAPRLQLRDPLPPVVDTPELLQDTCERIAAGTGPIALDAERASGYRYSQRAYLIQIRREGSGTHLVDPTAFDSLVPLDTAFDGNEWILHAATQDLMCLAEVGLYPEALFDTELAGRLLNLPRVGLAALVEHYLGLSLAKEFSAADWSTRPLPEPWLVYAALDVEVLIELRNLIDEDLQKAGKREWAAEEFEALLLFQGPPERKEPWRRTSGIHKARGRRALGLVRELWETRDRIAEQRDTTPGRILPDASILELATSPPQDVAALKSMRIMRNRGPRRFASEWFDAIERGLAIAEIKLPTTNQRIDGPPPPRAWADKNPAAADRLSRSREVVTALAEEHDLPTENLISPQLVRNLAWEPPAEITPETVGAALRDQGARRWQVGLVAAPLAEALADVSS
ncbi:HRDC domain-containing protein [Aeromicrobium chenweiae]|uniref:Ribonuclease D n=1 Tax=Aeromicrobium chenweiae TaxID=2079793 RepID=A0A2S0WMT0_9ACTN|nr:ribonuclease D [Aeromicrobium chenweiae]AWB92621.1 ribonuclease D [Aeromicrobium chenweiae]TGN33609.1 ribonuclease D [Aeromicrobium chenweiae]